MKFVLLLICIAVANAACDCTPDPTCFVITCPTLSVGSHSAVVLLFGGLDVSSATANPSFPSLVKITGSLTSTMNSAVTVLSFPQLVWIGDAGTGDLYIWGNTALAQLNLPRLSDIYGNYFISSNAALGTIGLPLLVNTQSLTHSATAVCNFCALCALGVAKPALPVSANSSAPLQPWAAFSAGCAANTSACNVCAPPTPSPSPSPSASPSPSMTTSASPTPSQTLSASPTASPTTSATPAPAAPCGVFNITFRYNPACGNATVLRDTGNSGLGVTNLYTAAPTYGTFGSCTYLRTQFPWFSSASDRTFAKALTTVLPSGSLTVMFWLRTSGATSNFQTIMSTRLTNNGATPQIAGSLKGWNIYINTNFTTNPAWAAEGNGPYLGWLSFWWSQCGNVTVLSNPITHGWRKFHILNLGANSTDLNTFMHIAIVYSNAAQSITAYKNGAIIGSISAASMGYWPQICAINNTDVYSGAPSLRIGQNNENVLYPANVDLGDVRIYTRNAASDIAAAASACAV